MIESVKGVRRFLTLRSPSVLAFDEFQFFGEEDAREAIELAREHQVIAAGLGRDFRGVAFPSMNVLFREGKALPRYAETWLKGRCSRCGRQSASLTQRLIDGKPAPWDSPLILPGGRSFYEPRCKECYEPPGRSL